MSMVIGVINPQVELSVIDTRQVSRTRWLMLFRIETKAVNINTISWSVGVMFIRLDVVEVVTFTTVKSVMTIELDKSPADWVAFTINQYPKVEWLVDMGIIGTSTSIFHAFNRE